MTIYLSHSRQFPFQTQLYDVVKHSSLIQDHAFVFPHEEEDVPFPTKDFLESEECDVVIAEVSYTSTGQGIELGWAEMLHIPIICVFRKGKKISQSLYVVTNKFMEYIDEEDMVEKMEKSLRFIEIHS